MKQKGKITGIFEKNKLNNGAIVQKISFKSEGEGAIYLNLFNNVHILKDLKVGDEVVIDYNSKNNGKYTNHYLNLIQLADEFEKQMEKEVKQEQIQEEKFDRWAKEELINTIIKNIHDLNSENWVAQGGKLQFLHKRILYDVKRMENYPVEQWGNIANQINNKIKNSTLKENLDYIGF